MKHFKKIIAVVLIALVITITVACSKQTNKSFTSVEDKQVQMQYIYIAPNGTKLLLGADGYVYQVSNTKVRATSQTWTKYDYIISIAGKSYFIIEGGAGLIKIDTDGYATKYVLEQ